MVVNKSMSKNCTGKVARNVEEQLADSVGFKVAAMGHADHGISIFPKRNCPLYLFVNYLKTRHVGRIHIPNHGRQCRQDL